MADGPQNPNQAIDVMSSITVVHVALMVALAAAMLAAIWWGVVLSRRRKAAQKQVDEDFAIAERHGATTTPASSVERAPTLSADVPEGENAPAQADRAGDLTRIKGLGPKLAATLAEQGITRVDQIAALTPAAAAALDATLGQFQGRMARDRWIEQARLLSAGDHAGYEAVFGKLGG